MRVVAKSTLVKFWSRPGCADSEGALQSWHDEAIKANWESPQNIKDQYRGASICGNNRVVFNIAGNKYRLVVRINYAYRVVYIRFIGTHTQYDGINVEDV